MVEQSRLEAWFKDDFALLHFTSKPSVLDGFNTLAVQSIDPHWVALPNRKSRE